MRKLRWPITYATWRGDRIDTKLIPKSCLKLLELLMLALGSMLFDEPWQILQLIVVPSNDLRFGSRCNLMFIKLLGMHGGLETF